MAMVTSNESHVEQQLQNETKSVVSEGEQHRDDTKKTQFEFSHISTMPSLQTNRDISFLLNIPLDITVELGRTKMVINDLLQLGPGSVVELAKLAGETLDIFVNQRLIARGEVVVVNEKYGARITEIVAPSEMIEGLR
jgi:flagellar motor switch protein FliN/FliY